MKPHLFAAWCCLLVTPLVAQTTYPAEVQANIKAVENGLAERIRIEGRPDYNLLARMAHYKVKGLSIAVVRNYQVEWAKGYGWADEQARKPVTTETLFEPGSISKSLNAVGVLKLVQDKKLDLHTDINTYLSSWKFPYDTVSHNKKITLAQLLSHSAGLGVHGFPGYDRKAAIPTVPQVLDGKAPANTPAVRSLFEPGLRFQYSGGGTTISQLIVTDVTKQPYDVFMYENVLKPIGMTHSFYTQPPAKDRLVLCATGYSENGTAVDHQFHVYPEQGAAGLWMTPTDLCQYIIETQLACEGKSAKVLNKEMTRLRLTPYNDQSAALGVFIDAMGEDKTLYFQHGAGNEGFRGQYYGSMEGGNGVVVFINSDNGAILNEVINSVAAVYGWKGFQKAQTRKTVKLPETILKTYPGVYAFEGMLTVVLKKDSTYVYCSDGTCSEMHFTSDRDFFNMEFIAEKHFETDANGHVTGFARKVNGNERPRAVKVTQIDSLKAENKQLNSIGWMYLQNKQYTEAAAYLQRGLQLYPGDPFILGNLAHCYLLSGKYNDALAIYKAHLGDTIQPGYTWKDMISEDFVYLKGVGLDKAPMQKMLGELKIKAPNGF